MEVADSEEEYFLTHLIAIPHYYAEAETNRLSIAYFCVAGLDALGSLDPIDRNR
jgi:hypothetical protein